MNRLREFVLVLLLLASCSPAMPIGPNEILPLSQQQTATGLYAIQNGAQNTYWIYEHIPSGIKIVMWPGATQPGQWTLIDMACIEQCGPGWQKVVSSYAMTSTKASEFANYLKGSPFWRQVSTLAPLAASTFIRLYADIATGGTTELMTVPAGLEILFPAPSEVQG